MLSQYEATLGEIYGRFEAGVPELMVAWAQGLFATVLSGAACAFIPGHFVLPRSWQQITLLIATGDA